MWSTHSSTTKDACTTHIQKYIYVISTCYGIVKITKKYYHKTEVQRQTFARPLLSNRNTSHFLNPWSLCMSWGISRAFSKHLDTSPDLSFWGSLRDASVVMGSPELSMKAGFHMEALECCSPLLPLPATKAVPFFCWALMTLGSLVRSCCVDWGISPSFEPSVGFLLFHFFSGASAVELWVKPIGQMFSLLVPWLQER